MLSMAVEDYSKLTKTVAKWHKEQTKVFDQRWHDVDKARVIAMKADHWLAARRKDWTKQNKDLLAKDKTWRLMAEEIVRLQKEHGEAKKSKDSAKAKALELDIQKIDSRATSIVDEFTAMHTKLAKDDKELGDMLRALDKLGL